MAMRVSRLSVHSDRDRSVLERKPALLRFYRTLIATPPSEVAARLAEQFSATVGIGKRKTDVEVEITYMLFRSGPQVS